MGKSFYFDNESFPVAYCDHLIRCTPTGVLRGKLLSMFMRCGYVRQLIDERMVSAAGQNTISQPSLATILLPVPPLKEQDRISHRLNNADNYISQIYNSKQRLADLVLHTKAKTSTSPFVVSLYHKTRMMSLPPFCWNASEQRKKNSSDREKSSGTRRSLSSSEVRITLII